MMFSLLSCYGHYSIPQYIVQSPIRAVCVELCRPHAKPPIVPDYISKFLESNVIKSSTMAEVVSSTADLDIIFSFNIRLNLLWDKHKRHSFPQS